MTKHSKPGFSKSATAVAPRALGGIRELLLTRMALLACALIIFIGTAIPLCGGNLLFFAVLLTDGMLAAGWILGAIALGALILDRWRSDISPALYVATAAGLGLGIFSLLGLGLGLLGCINRPIAIGLPALPAIAWLVVHYRQLNSSMIRPWLRAPAGRSWVWLIPVVSLTIALVSASKMPGILWKPLDPHPYDVTGYHLLVPREWYECGRIVPLEHNVYSFFEFNVEMQFLLLMHAAGGPWAAMYACQFLCVGYSVLMVVAVAGTAVTMGERSTLNVQLSTFKEENHRTCPAVPDSSLESWKLKVQSWTFATPDQPILGAAFAATVPWVIMLAGVAYVESALMLYTALAIAWALNAVRQPGHLVRSLVLSGILAGFACGVKITAVPMLLLAVPVATAIVLMIRRPAELPTKRLLIGCAALLFAGSMVVSPWLIRNFIWAGNPLFPVGMKALGRDHFDDVQVKRFHDAHSPTAAQQAPFAGVKVLWRDVLTYWQFGYILLPLGLIACVIRCRDRQTWLIVICGCFVVVVWIGFTHLLPRFLVMLVPIAAIAVGRIRWGRAWPVGVALLLYAAGLGWWRVVPELMRQPSVIGLEDLTFALSPELIAARDNGMQIGLVGDAQAFLYQIPLKQMHYRAVFNVHTGTDDPIQAWIGSDPIGNPNWLLVINPTEIQRLHETYYGIPALPPDWAARGSNAFYIRGDQLRRK